MHYFQLIRTARFSFTLQELSLADTRHLLNISPDFAETFRSEFLKRAVKELTWHKGYETHTLEDLTLQERLFIEASYLSQVAENPDFELGNGVYSDFLQVEKQYRHKQLEVGKIEGDDDIWFIRPATGLMLEAIEERVFALTQPSRVEWLSYAMAAQLFRENEECPDPKADFMAYGDWLDKRAETVMSLPETAFLNLIQLYFRGMEQLTHFFAVSLDDQGFHLIPTHSQKTIEGEEIALFPARFHPLAKISPATQQLCGKFDEVSP